MRELQPKPLLRIKAERILRGWTQLELAFRARVPVSELSRIETGRSKPYPSHAARLAETLGLKESELVEAAQ
jgi:transcriptional regulator with XRE-family HTH domain